MEGDDFQSATETFFTWLSDVGVQVNPKMTWKDFRSEGRGRGVVAVADFAEDEIVFSIPRAVVLNVNNISVGKESNVSKEALLQMPSWLALTATMISEGQQSASKWAPYLAILPQKLDSLVFWSEQELAELQASSVVRKIGRATAEEMFIKHMPALELGGYNTEMYHQVASVIMAYAFDIPENHIAIQDSEPADGEGDDLVSDDGEDEKTTLSMIPLADMLNADAERNNARLHCDSGDLEMRTIKPIAEGEEILNDYGQLPRSDLLRCYGYVTDNYAPFDVAEISTASIISLLSNSPFEISSRQFLDPLSAAEVEKRTALADRECGLEESYDVAYATPDDQAIPNELLAFLYIFLLDTENLEDLATSRTALPSRSKLATALAGKILATLFQQREKEYQTTAEEDEALLQAGNSNTRVMMAIQVRLGEKKVLRHAVEEALKFEGSDKRMRATRGSALDTAKNGKDKSKKRRTEDTISTTKKARHR